MTIERKHGVNRFTIHPLPSQKVDHVLHELLVPWKDDLVAAAVVVDTRTVIKQLRGYMVSESARYAAGLGIMYEHARWQTIGRMNDRGMGSLLPKCSTFIQ